MKLKSITKYIIFVSIFLLFTISYTFNIFNGSHESIKIDNYYINELSSSKASNDGEISYEITANINKAEFKKLNNESIYKLVINRISAEWYAVYFNEDLLGTYGDKNGNSNIWNSVQEYNLNSEIIEEKNQLKLLINNISKPDISYPILITETREGHLIKTWNDQILANLNVLTIGFMVFAIIILTTIYKKSGKKKKEYFYLRIACISVLVSLFQTLDMPYLFLSGILLRKISVAFMYLAVYAFSMSLYKEYNFKLNKILGLFSLLCFFIILFSPARYFPVLDKNLSIIIGINILSWFFISAKYIKIKEKAKVFFCSSFFALIPVIIDLILLYNKTLVNFHYSLIGIFVFAFSIILYLVYDYNLVQKEVNEHKKIAEIMYDKSIRDSMTGIYNHGYISSILTDKNEGYSLIIMDIDNFKDINDKYGHQAGDEVIKHVAKAITKITRKSDIVGRYGGDEFIIVILEENYNSIKKVANKIKEEIEKPYKSKYGEIGITVSMGIYIKEENEKEDNSLAKADKALYYVKNHGKADMKIYNKELK